MNDRDKMPPDFASTFTWLIFVFKGKPGKQDEPKHSEIYLLVSIDMINWIMINFCLLAKDCSFNCHQNTVFL